MSRLLESTAPVVDVAISPVDTARASQLTTIDFFILDNAKRAELTGLVESRNPSASVRYAPGIEFPPPTGIGPALLLVR